MNSRLASLQRYPFERLAELIKDVTPPANKSPIKMSMGEPQHAAPAFVLEALTKNLKGLSNYPTTKGAPALREAIARWATKRFTLDKIKLDPERHVLPVAGTREALFSIAQAVVDRKAHADQPVVISPNPFYQIYEGAALLAGARCFFSRPSRKTTTAWTSRACRRTSGRRCSWCTSARPAIRPARSWTAPNSRT